MIAVPAFELVQVLLMEMGEATTTEEAKSQLACQISSPGVDLKRRAQGHGKPGAARQLYHLLVSGLGFRV